MTSSTVISAFEFASMEMGVPIYEVRLVSETGASICTSIGASVAAEPLDDTNFGTLTPGLIKSVRQALGQYRRIAATCTGAFILAEASLLDGRRPDHALVLHARLAGSVPKSEGGGRSRLHRRQPGADFDRDDREYRPRAGYDRKGSGRRPGRRRRTWWSITDVLAVFAAARAGTQIPTVSRAHRHMRSAVSRVRCRLDNSPKQCV
jgi:hypothetical protein